MNPLLNNLNLNEYFDFEDYDLVRVDPSDASAGTRVELTETGIELVVKDAVDLFKGVCNQQLMDPLSYIQTSIQKMIDTSSASEDLKAQLSPQTEIGVYVIKGRPSSGAGLIGVGLKPETTLRYVSLEDIVTDKYRHKIKDDTELNVKWPSDFPPDLIDTLESANLQKSYEAQIKRHLQNPNAKAVIQLLARKEAEDKIRYCIDHPMLSETFKNVAKGYASGETVLKIVEYRSYVSRTHLSQVLLLQEADDTAAEGLLIFLGEPEETAIIGLPRTGRRWFIESSRALAKLSLQRLALSHQLRKGNEKLIYHTLFTVGGSRTISPLQFYKVDDVFEALHAAQINKLLFDIDTLVSTDDERLMNGLLDIGTAILSGLSVVALSTSIAKNGLSYLLASFLAGQSVSSMKILRAAYSDTPDELLEAAKLETVSVFVSACSILLSQMIGDAAESAAELPVVKRLVSELKQFLASSVQ